MVDIEIKNITNSSMLELTTDDKTTPTSAVTNFNVSVPCIINTVEIAAGAEIVVKVDKKHENRVIRMRQKGKASLHSASKLPAAAARKAKGSESLRTACWGSAG